MQRLALLLCLLPVLAFASDRTSRSENSSCARCHVPHVSKLGIPPTVRKSSDDTCLSCHDGLIAIPFNSSSFGHVRLEDSDVQAKCTSCHRVHALHR